MLQQRFFDTRQAAKFLGYSVHTLRYWRVHGGGPRFTSPSTRKTLYRKRDLMEWVELSATKTHTHDAPQWKQLVRKKLRADLLDDDD